jgi:hypothetical protein
MQRAFAADCAAYYLVAIQKLRLDSGYSTSSLSAMGKLGLGGRPFETDAYPRPPFSWKL